MKARKIISSLLTGIGCIVLFVGLAGFILPRIDNPQMKLVLSSFQQPSGNVLIQLMNNGMNLAMKHCFPMLLIGSGILAGGVLMTLSLRTDEEAQALRQRRAAAAPVPYARPVAEPEEVIQPAAPVQPPVINPFARIAAPEPEDTRPAPPAGTNPFARPAGEQAAVQEPVEENPFARYIPADALPKSTPRKKKTAAAPAAAPEATAAAVPATAFAATETVKAEEPALPAAQEPEAPHIEAVVETAPAEETDAYAAYQRPAEEIAIPPVASVPPEKEAVPGLPEDAAAPAVSHEPLASAKEEPASLHKPAPAPAAALSPRPLIRSTFRTSTPAQPEETDSAASDQPAPPQPSSRIKSTMGRKR